MVGSLHMTIYFTNLLAKSWLQKGQINSFLKQLEFSADRSFAEKQTVAVSMFSYHAVHVDFVII